MHTTQTKRVTPAEYYEADWGDLIIGTKQQLQAFGIGLGRAFPGEPGAPRYQLKVADMRGFEVELSSRWRKDGRLSASVRFPAGLARRPLRLLPIYGAVMADRMNAAAADVEFQGWLRGFR